MKDRKPKEPKGGGGVATAPPPIEDTAPPEPVTPEHERVRIGDIVHTIDRSRYISAKERGAEPEPIAGVVARINRDKNHVRTGQVSLLVVQPNGIPLDLLDVPFSPELKPAAWTFRELSPESTRVSVPMSMLVEAVKTALALMGFTPPTEDATAGKPKADA